MKVSVYIGSKLKQGRKLKGLTQAELAKCAGVSYQQIQKYETGANNPSPETLLTLCQAIGVNIVDIYPNIELNENKNIYLTNNEVQLVKLYRSIEKDIALKIVDLIKHAVKN